MEYHIAATFHRQANISLHCSVIDGWFESRVSLLHKQTRDLLLQYGSDLLHEVIGILMHDLNAYAMKCRMDKMTLGISNLAGTQFGNG